MSSSTKKCEESCCLCSCTLHGSHHFHTERFTTEMQRFVIGNSDLKGTGSPYKVTTMLLIALPFCFYHISKRDP